MLLSGVSKGYIQNTGSVVIPVNVHLKTNEMQLLQMEAIDPIQGHHLWKIFKHNL